MTAAEVAKALGISVCGMARGPHAAYEATWSVTNAKGEVTLFGATADDEIDAITSVIGQVAKVKRAFNGEVPTV